MFAAVFPAKVAVPPALTPSTVGRSLNTALWGYAVELVRVHDWAFCTSPTKMQTSPEDVPVIAIDGIVAPPVAEKLLRTPADAGSSTIVSVALFEPLTLVAVTVFDALLLHPKRTKKQIESLRGVTEDNVNSDALLQLFSAVSETVNTAGPPNVPFAASAATRVFPAVLADPNDATCVGAEKFVPLADWIAGSGIAGPYAISPL